MVALPAFLAATRPITVTLARRQRPEPTALPAADTAVIFLEATLP
jgi:hypothetical protein